MKRKTRRIYRDVLKRVIDLLFSICALVVLSPAFLIVSIFVRSKLGSPVIYKQKRPGKIDKKTGQERMFEM